MSVKIIHLKKADDRCIAEETADSLGLGSLDSPHHHPLGPHHPLNTFQALHVSYLFGVVAPIFATFSANRQIATVADIYPQKK